MPESKPLPSRPLRVHKRFVIHLLAAHPDEVRDFLPSWEGTAEEAIEALRDDPREWMDEFEKEEEA